MVSSKGSIPVFCKILLVLITGCIIIAAGIPATADSETGVEGTVSDDPVVVDVTVNPDRSANCLKTMEMGAVKIVVLGSPDIDARAIDPESLTVSSEKNDATVYPSGFYYEDLSEDGFEDLVLEVNCRELVVKLGLKNCFCNTVPLTINGALKDGSGLIKGTGTTVILPGLR